MNVTAIFFVLMITSHGKSAVIPTAYESQLACETDAKHLARKMKRGAAWQCFQVVKIADRSAMLHLTPGISNQEYR